MNQTEEFYAEGMPWTITDREKLWNECFNWLQKEKRIKIIEVSARYSKVRFIKKCEWWKLYLPYDDTGLGVVLLNENSSTWVEIIKLNQLKVLIK